MKKIPFQTLQVRFRQSFAQVMTTVTFRIPTQRAPRGGRIIGGALISSAELMQYALTIVSSGWQESEGRPRSTRNKAP
jgi:hypothetical protein